MNANGRVRAAGQRRLCCATRQMDRRREPDRRLQSIMPLLSIVGGKGIKTSETATLQ